MTTFQSILFVGCGNMGGAILDGWLAGGLDPARFTIVSPNRSSAPDGVRLLRTIPNESFDVIVLGVKPQMLDQVVDDVQRVAGPDTCVLSLLAGIELATLSERFPQAGGIVRLMPNLAVALGKSPLGLVATGVSPAEREGLDTLLTPLGSPEWLDDEGLFNLLTALAGSGPGFVYRFIDSLAAGAAELGLPRDQADRLALSMVEGAAALAAASPHTPGELARRVASPGGMTQKGLDVLDEGAALEQLLTETLRAARDRGAELAAMAREKS